MIDMEVQALLERAERALLCYEFAMTPNRDWDDAAPGLVADLIAALREATEGQ